MENFLKIRVDERKAEADAETNRTIALHSQLHAIKSQIEEYYATRTKNVVSGSLEGKTLLTLGVNDSMIMSINIIDQDKFIVRVTEKEDKTVTLKGLADIILDCVPL